MFIYEHLAHGAKVRWSAGRRVPGQQTVHRVAQMTDAVSEEMPKKGMLSWTLHFLPAQAGCIKRPNGGANFWGGTSAEPWGDGYRSSRAREVEKTVW